MKVLVNGKWLSIALMLLVSSFALTSCGSGDDDDPTPNPQEMIVGKWISYYDAYGDPWIEPLEYQFYADGTGYGWFQEEPFSYRWEFTYAISQTKIRFNEDGEIYHLPYEMSADGKSLVLYDMDEDDLQEIHFVKQ